MEQTFEIIITSCENATWQGTLKADRASVPFRSELELLLELARLMGPGDGQSPAFEEPRGV